MLPETFVELLSTSVIMGLITSVLLSRWGWFNRQDTATKSRITGAITFVVGVVILAIQQFVPDEAMGQIGEVYKALKPFLELLLSMAVTSGALYATSQVWYAAAGKRLFSDDNS